MLRELRKLDLFPYEEMSDSVFVDSRRFFAMLEHHFTSVDVITYTYGYHPLQNVRKVITAIICCDPKTIAESCKEMRIETNTHTKLYLGFVGNKLINCFTGSLNLRSGINYNLMYRVSQKHNKELQNYFDTLWKHAKQFSAKLNAGDVYANQQNKT